MQKVLLIARTEFIKHLRKPSFWFTLLFVPVLLLIIMLTNNTDEAGEGIPGLEVATQVQADPTILRLGVVDQSGLIEAIPSGFPQTTADLYQLFASATEAEAAVKSEAIQAYYVVPADYLQTGIIYRYSEQFDPFLGSLQEQLVELLLLTSMAPEQDTLYARALLDPTVGLSVESVNPSADTSAAEATNAVQKQQEAFLLGIMFSMVLYMSIFVSASWLLQALLEEKENRVIEVVLSSVTSQQLLLGKTLGLGLLGLFELLVWLGFGAVLLAQGPSLTTALIAVDISVWMALLMLVCFILGFLMYGSLMAGIGAVANTMRESSQLTVVMAVPIIIPLIFSSVLITQPNGILAQVLTYIPLTAPIVLVMRAAITTLPLWQILLSIGLMFVMFVALQLLAARMFRASNLLSGTQPTLRGVLRAMRAD